MQLLQLYLSNLTISLTHISLDLINMPVDPYDTCVLYINMTLKEYPYLFLFNNDRYNNGIDIFDYKSRSHNGRSC